MRSSVVLPQPLGPSRQTNSPASTRLEATTGSVIMNVVKIGAQLESPNQMIEMTIQTKTDVEFSTERKSWITPRAVRERNDARPASSATSTKPRATASGEGRT